jgi:hypothetical protein
MDETFILIFIIQSLLLDKGLPEMYLLLIPYGTNYYI